MADVITVEQAALGPKFRDYWKSRARAFGRTDRATVERAITGAYSVKSLARPEIIWRESPARGLVAAVKVGASGQKMIRSAVIDAPLTTASDFVSKTLSPKVLLQLQKGMELPVAAVGKPLRDAINIELKIRASVAGDVNGTAGELSRGAVDFAFAGTMECNFVADLDYIDRVLKLGGPLDSVRDIVALCSYSGWLWAFTHVVVVTELPVAIHLDGQLRPHRADGPAIEYSDGFSVYCWQGSVVPKDSIDRKVSWDEIKSIKDQGMKGAVADVRVDQWSAEASAGAEETSAERRGAADAIKRLGGLDALEGLTDGEEGEGK